MTFTEWYLWAYDEEWHEDYALLYSHATEAMDGYEAWCQTKTKTLFGMGKR